jgi:uncharacterized membrane protein SpoIIM required for sporulation
VVADLTQTEKAFVARALRRRRLFLALSIVGLVVAAGLGVYYTWRWGCGPSLVEIALTA